jgi:hypothetical protein
MYRSAGGWDPDQVFGKVANPVPTPISVPMRAAAKESTEHFVTSEQWSVDRPDVMVVACSDGRLQFSIDHFLNAQLSVKHYDRMFMPGGSGALVAGGCEFIRAEHYRRDLYFLLEAHGTDDLILLAHGAAESGPPEATCAHYRRLMPYASLEEVRNQQIVDIREFLKSAHTQLSKVRVRAFRAEVMADLTVRYVEVV